jgi:branched-chain amino acid transport system substrate-binding protein
MKLRTVSIAALLAAALASPAVLAQKTIKIGNTNPYSGPASAYGAIGQSIGAYWKMVNDQGGINGRKVEWISYDDGYSPPKTVEMTRRLVEQDEVLLVFQPLGTPPNSAIHKYMNAKKVPQLFVATGATKWNDPKRYPWTMGWQPNYQTEGRVYAEHILKNNPKAKIGVLYQNDDYGKDYLQGFKDGLGDKARSMIVSEVSYEVADPTVDSQMVQLQASGADTFFNITTPKFAAQAIRKAYDSGWKPTHYLNNVSNSIGSVLKPAGLDKSVGLISTFYLKDPADPQWKDDPAVKAWQAFKDKYDLTKLPDQFTSYGMAVAQTLHQVLRQAGNDLSRANIMKQAANLKNFRSELLLPGIRINTSATDFAPIESEQLVRFDGKTWQRFGPIIGK